MLGLKLIHDSKKGPLQALAPLSELYMVNSLYQGVIDYILIILFHFIDINLNLLMTRYYM